MDIGQIEFLQAPDGLVALVEVLDADGEVVASLPIPPNAPTVVLTLGTEQ